MNQKELPPQLINNPLLFLKNINELCILLEKNLENTVKNEIEAQRNLLILWNFLSHIQTNAVQGNSSLLQTKADLNNNNSSNNNNSNNTSNILLSDYQREISDNIKRDNDKKETSSNENIKEKKKKRIGKICTGCPHTYAKHYAKNMCSNCYHSKGRNKKPWNCSHVNKTHYALGLCQNCYHVNYIKGKK